MEKTLKKLINLIYYINLKNDLRGKKKDYVTIKDCIKSENKITKNLENIITKVRENIKAQDIEGLWESTINLSLSLCAVENNLLSIEELIHKTIRQLPLNENNFELHIKFPLNIKALIEKDLIIKQNQDNIDSNLLYENGYKLNITFSPILRKNDYLFKENKIYKLYDQANYCFKLAFNEDGSCNILETKRILDKIPLQDEKLFG